MTAAAAVIQAQIHLAACRYRRQNLVCSHCAWARGVVGRAAR